MQNSLKIDFFTLNIKSPVEPSSVVKLLCDCSLNQDLEFDDFFHVPTGAIRGYNNSYRYLGENLITVSWHSDFFDFGISINITGKGTNFFSFDCFNNLYNELIKCDIQFNVTRVDLAYDDYIGNIPVDNFLSSAHDFVSTNLGIVTNKKRETVTFYSGVFNNKLYENLVFGKRSSSEQLFRLYDKRAEQKRTDIDYWYRLEIELRSAKANKVCDLIFKEKCDFKDVFFKLLVSFFRPVEVKDCAKRANLPTAQWFQDFMNSLNLLSIKYTFKEELKKKVDLIKDKLKHLSFQYGKTIALIEEWNPFALKEIIRSNQEVIKNNIKYQRILSNSVEILRCS